MRSAVPSAVQPQASRQDAAWGERSGRLFEELRTPCARMISRAYGANFTDDEIEDVYSSAWAGTLRALEARQATMDDEEVRRYVFAAVAGQASKEVRRRKRRPVAPLERASVVVDHAPALEERIDQVERSQITRDLLASMPRRRRAVLLLRYGWGLEPAQICELIEGLSPRAYRKEITRGIDELTEKVKTLEAGNWCADREPILKAFAAGLADAEQQRQAQHHLAHCRPCGEFVGRLSGHLHDFGSAAALPGAVEVAADGRLDVPGRIGDLAERARDSIGSVLPGGSSPAAESAAASLPSAAPKGAGAASAGALAKLAGLGVAGKAVVTCATGGAVATVCVVAAVGPLDLSELERSQAVGPSAHRLDEARRPGGDGPRGYVTPVLAAEGPPDPAPEPPPPDPEPPPPDPEPEPAPEPTAPAIPSGGNDFDVVAPATSSSSSTSSSTSDRGTAAAQEFGP